MQGANRSKVEHLARICNAADAAFWRKSRRNTKCKQTLKQAQGGKQDGGGGLVGVAVVVKLLRQQV